VTDERDERQQDGRDHDLVDDHQDAAAAGEVEPRPEQRPGHEARQRHGGDGGARQRLVPGAVEHEQHDAHPEHLVGDARQRGRGHEAQVAGLRPQAA
jgi:hypothetical protein